ncbi:MAG: hypothetical protein AAF628_30610 [Planctomycetota bacterium]
MTLARPTHAALGTVFGGAELRAWGLVLGTALTVEVGGRAFARSDIHDGAVLATLCLIALNVRTLGGVRRAMHRLGGVTRALMRQLRHYQIELGVDLRERPSIPRELPPVMLLALRGAVTLAVVAIAVTLAPISAGRDAWATVLYLGYLAGLAGLWAGLLTVALGGALLPAACIHDALLSTQADSPRRRYEIASIGSYLGITLVAGLTLPAWVPLAVTAATATLFVVTMQRSSPAVTLLWRARAGGRLRSIDWRRFEIGCAMGVLALFVAVVVAAVGRPALGLPGAPDPSMPVTQVAGAVASWLGAAAMALGCAFAVQWMRHQRLRDPARPKPRLAHLGGSATRVPEAASILQGVGWRTVATSQPHPEADLRIEVLDAPMPPLQRRQREPLQVSVRALALPELQQVLARRADAHRRAELVRGLETLFSRATSRSYRNGNGFWVAPQYWWVIGLTRDIDEDDYHADGALLTGVVGPAYHRVLPLTARQHCHEVLKALDIDLLFVEDGVGFAGLERVLSVLFEHFDRHDGQRRIEERDLTGLIGIRACLHDFELGKPRRPRDFPEPDYDTLGRARILHLARDRGGSHEADVPMDSQLEPTPAGVA